MVFFTMLFPLVSASAPSLLARCHLVAHPVGREGYDVLTLVGDDVGNLYKGDPPVRGYCLYSLHSPGIRCNQMACCSVSISVGKLIDACNLISQ